jgi:hypothetical protein
MIEAGNGSSSGDSLEQIIRVYKEFSREFPSVARRDKLTAVDLQAAPVPIPELHQLRDLTVVA